ncbi:MAG: hypothetical protein AB1400_05695 [Pseudomonadota bacterium]
MDDKNTLLDSFEDAAETMLWLVVLSGLFLGALAIVWQILKWIWQAIEWSTVTKSKARWLILAPIMAIFMPFWLAWLAAKWCGFQLFRLFLRTIIACRHLFS